MPMESRSERIGVVFWGMVVGIRGWLFEGF